MIFKKYRRFYRASMAVLKAAWWAKGKQMEIKRCLETVVPVMYSFDGDDAPEGLISAVFNQFLNPDYTFYLLNSSIAELASSMWQDLGNVQYRNSEWLLFVCKN